MQRISPDFIEAHGQRLLDEVRAKTRHPLLEGCRVEASMQLTSCAGMAYPGKGLVKISAPIFVRSQDHAALRDTILHEIAHIMTPGEGHNYKWRNAALSIGSTATVYHHQETGPHLGVQTKRAKEDRVDVVDAPDAKGNEHFTFDILSEATGEKFKPLQVNDDDRLLVWMNAEGDRFILETIAVERKKAHIAAPWVTKRHPWRSPSWKADQLFSRLPEVRWLGKQNPSKRHRYVAAATDYTAIAIRSAFPADKIIYGSGLEAPDEEARMLMDALTKRFMAQTARATRQARFKTSGELTPLPRDWREHTTLKLAPYQQEAVMFAQGYDGTALFMDRGTGKTAAVIQLLSIEAARHKAKTGKMYRAIIVVPNQVRQNWENEILRFAVAPGKVAIMRSGKRKRISTLTHAVTTEDDCDFSVLICGYESLVGTADEIAKVPWDLMVCDESHFFKSPRTQRWKAVRRIAKRSRKRIAMTGSPIGNTPMDLWTQLEYLGEGLSGFQTYKDFRAFHGKWETNGSAKGVEKLVGLQRIPLLQERLTRLTFQVNKKEAGLQLPDKRYDIHEVEMTPEQAKLYQDVADRLVAEMEDKLSGEVNELVIQNVLTQLLRLAQITSGHIRWDAVYAPSGELVEPSRLQHIAIPNPKTEAVIDIVKEEDPDSKIIVWCTFVPDIEGVSARLEEEGIDHVTYYGKTPQKQRDDIVNRFNNDPNCRVIVCNPQTAGEGLNLLGYDWTKETDDPETHTGRVIFYSQNWSSILRAQAEDRAHRRGTKRTVQFTDLQVPGTIDEEIYNRVRGKLEMAGTVLDVKSILQSVVNNLRQ